MQRSVVPPVIRRWSLTALAAVIPLASLKAGRASAEELSKLTVGSILPLSGPQAAYGKEATRGLDLAMDALRLKDPELAGRVSLIAGDDQSTPKDAAAAADKLLDKDHANILIGSVTTATTAAAAAAARKHQVPMVAPVTAQTSVPMGGGLYRACAGEAAQGGLLAEFALSVLGVKRAATLRDVSPGAQAFTDRFDEVFKAGGGTIGTDATYDLTSEDFTVPLQKIQTSGAKLIVTPAPYHTAAAILTQGRKIDGDFKFLGGDSWDTPAFNKSAGPVVAGNFFVSHFAADDPTPAVAEFVKAFQLKYGRAPGALAALTYDAAVLTFDAFKRARSNLKYPLTAALDKSQALAGVTGLYIAFEGGEPLKVGVIKETTADGAKFKARVTPRRPGGPAEPPPPPQAPVPSSVPSLIPAPAAPIPAPVKSH